MADDDEVLLLLWKIVLFTYEIIIVRIRSYSRINTSGSALLRRRMDGHNVTGIYGVTGSNTHCWLAFPCFAHKRMLAPLSLLPPQMSMALPDCGFTIVWSSWITHFWFQPPCLSHRWMLAPSALLPPAISRTLPECGLAMLPSGSSSHCWFHPPCFSQRWMLEPLSVDPPFMSSTFPVCGLVMK